VSVLILHTPSPHREFAKLAHKKNITLKEACCTHLRYLSEADFDKYCDPAKMIGPSADSVQ
jgi:fumarate hydratase class II